MATVLLSGASGFIGSALSRSLAADGHAIVRLVRGGRAGGGIRWDAERGQVDRAALESLHADAVVNLAGEPIAHRWTSERRRRIRDSRVNGTRALSEALAALARRPRVLVSGSAIGYYGMDRGDELLDEESAPGSDFLATTSRDWERATSAAADAGIRVALIRTGVVVGRGGGALARMLPPFRAGIGGPLGNGRQWMSWISLTDTVAAIRFLLEREDARGPYNLAAPEPERNADFARILGRVLHRPAVLPVPRLALLALFGDMARHTVLASQRVLPRKLQAAGFQFRHPGLEEALRFELRR